MLLDYFRMFAGYNAWANRRVYDVAAELSEAEWTADRGAFFRSMQGTLNHLVIGDRVWMRRFTGEGPAPDRLDAVPYPAFADLRPAREAEDARILRYVDGLDADRIAGTIHYTPITDPRPIAQVLGEALVHFFNHQTHHRGQAHAVLTGLGRTAPALDLLLYQRERGADRM